MGEYSIERVHAREILDSRGRPTVEAEVHLRGGAIGRAAVPSGASTGSREAHELRDGGERYCGYGVLHAVMNVNGEIAKRLDGFDSREQESLDSALIDLDGSSDERKRRLGANALLAVSLANAHAAAHQSSVSLYEYIRTTLYPIADRVGEYLLPLPMLNFINGGAHADNSLDFQEFMLVPVGASSFEEALQWSADVYRTLVKSQRVPTSSDLGGVRSYGVGDEGGFSIALPPDVADPRRGVEYVLELLGSFVDGAKRSFGRDGDFALALDPAASEFFTNDRYLLGRRGDKPAEQLTSQELADFYAQLADTYPIISIEDGMAEDDLDGWRLLTKKLGSRCQLVGDDLFVTNPELVEWGIDTGLANAVLVKANQIGTLTETLRVIRIAQNAGYGAIVSHRSGETEDTTISDLAVATNSGQIKSGCLSRSDRTSKYNRLLEIAAELGPSGRFDGSAWRTAIKFSRAA